MDHESQLKLQAYLDGELSAREARRVAAWLVADADARALAGELDSAKWVLADNETPIPLPETREFYWSKIEREIRRQAVAESASAASRAGVWWKRMLVPAASVACVAMIVGLVVRQLGSDAGGVIGRHELVASLSDSGATTYRDDAAGITLVWFSYPAQN